MKHKKKLMLYDGKVLKIDGPTGVRVQRVQRVVVGAHVEMVNGEL